MRSSRAIQMGPDDRLGAENAAEVHRLPNLPRPDAHLLRRGAARYQEVHRVEPQPMRSLAIVLHAHTPT